jgi:hypothetical protein
MICVRLSPATDHVRVTVRGTFLRPVRGGAGGVVVRGGGAALGACTSTDVWANNLLTTSAPVALFARQASRLSPSVLAMITKRSLEPPSTCTPRVVDGSHK